jgi:hypothetical protein
VLKKHIAHPTDKITGVGTLNQRIDMINSNHPSAYCRHRERRIWLSGVLTVAPSTGLGSQLVLFKIDWIWVKYSHCDSIPTLSYRPMYFLLTMIFMFSYVLLWGRNTNYFICLFPSKICIFM